MKLNNQAHQQVWEQVTGKLSKRSREHISDQVLMQIRDQLLYNSIWPPGDGGIEISLQIDRALEEYNESSQ